MFHCNRIYMAMMFTLVLSSCANRPVAKDEHFQPEVVAAAESVTVLVDVAVTQGKTLDDPMLKLEESEVIASAVNKEARQLLSGKGYAVKGQVVESVGLSLPSSLKVSLDYDRARYTDAGVSSTAPFLLRNESDAAAEGLKHIYSVAATPLDTRRAPNADVGPDAMHPFGDTLLVVISVKGHFISGGQLAGNIAKGSLAFLAAVGGHSTDVDMDADTADLDVRVYEAGTGRLLWHHEDHAARNPDVKTFSLVTAKVFSAFPDRAQSGLKVK